MDDRLQQLIREIGDAPAFPGPLSGLPHERGMTYRQWLIGLALSGSMTNGVANTQRAVESKEVADIIITCLARERMESEVDSATA